MVIVPASSCRLGFGSSSSAAVGRRASDDSGGGGGVWLPTLPLLYGPGKKSRAEPSRAAAPQLGPFPCFLPPWLFTSAHNYSCVLCFSWLQCCMKENKLSDFVLISNTHWYVHKGRKVSWVVNQPWFFTVRRSEL